MTTTWEANQAAKSVYDKLLADATKLKNRGGSEGPSREIGYAADNARQTRKEQRRDEDNIYPDFLDNIASGLCDANLSDRDLKWFRTRGIKF